MATYTTDFLIRPEDGWTLVATNPSQLVIKAAVFHPWWVAITDTGTPAATVVGVPMGRDPSRRLEEYVLENGATGLVYVRIATPPNSDTSSYMAFNVTAVAGAGGGGGGSGNSTAGITASASFTPTAVAYGAGDLISVAQEFVFTYSNGLAIPSGSLIRILSATMKIDATALQASEGAYSLYSYGVTPPSAQADNATWTLASADLPSYKGMMSMGTPVDLGAALYVQSNGIDNDIKLTGTSLFGELVTVAAFTPTAVARQINLRGIVL